MFPFLSFSQVDHVGSGRALLLDGVDDYVDLGNIYDNVTLPVTVSAWVKLDPSMPTQIAPIFVSQDNSPLYNGFWLGISATTVFMEYGDGFGENNPAYRRGKSVSVSIANNQWVHVCGVMRSASDISIYINGINFGGSSTGSSNNPMSSNFPADVAKIGYLYTNGVTHHFKGMIDEVRVWNRSLSQTEVRDGMCKKLNGNETGLIGYWTFDETTGSLCDDASPSGYNGVAGGSQRAFSGAPIGDESAYLYPGVWTGNSVSLTYGTDKLQVSNVQGFPNGVHVYAVNDQPSQTSGLPAGKFDKPYMGVFAGTIDNSGTFDVAYYDNNVLACQGMQRRDNSVSSWGDQPLTGILKSTEIIKVPCCVPLDVDLGGDQHLCGATSYTLQAPSQFSGMNFLWSTGATTPSITVNAPGDYWLKVGDCSLSRDTVAVDFQRSPLPFSLGQDESLCTMNARFLNPYLSPPADYDFTWQDGSKNQGMLVNTFGKYWVKVKNSCGSTADTVVFSKIPPENISVDLGADRRVCDQTSTTLTLAANLTGKSILWSTGSTSPSIVVTQAKKYAIKVSGVCEIATDTVEVTFLKSPLPFSLGQDERLCDPPIRFLSPITNPPPEDDFTWQDGSKNQGMLVNDFGKYWVKVKNFCGSFSDTVTFFKIPKINIDVDLGADKNICDQTFTTLSVPANLANKTILWSTGSTLPSIIVTESKGYSVKVSDACGSDADTVAVAFVKTPPVFSLGNDETICVVKPRKLSPVKESNGLQFEWQDGSSDSTFTVHDFGEYWVRVFNVCGMTSDTITLNKLPVDKNKIPNVITPGDDQLNENFVVEPPLLGSQFTVFNRWGERVYDNPNYQNNWNGGSLASGVYFFILRSDCLGQIKGNVSLIKGE